MKKLCWYLLILGVMCNYGMATAPRTCNGHACFWNRKYNEVAYATTNNCHACTESEVCHQDKTIVEQLHSGIRALKLDIWPDVDAKGNVYPCVCQGADQKRLYAISEESILAQAPLMFRPFVSSALKKMAPMKSIISDALHYAYGNDVSSSKIPFNYCAFDPSKRPLKTMLADVKKFLDANHCEIVTLLIEDHTKNLDSIAKTIKDSAMVTYAHVQDSTKPWPTLGQMVTANKRLVIFVQGDATLPYKKYPWLHNMWDYAWSTEWNFENPGDLKCKDCAVKIGKNAFNAKDTGPKNKLFMVNHFLTNVLSGNKSGAKRINKRSTLRERVLALAKEAKHMPNFVSVDFYQYPNNDIFDVVNEINGVGCYAGSPLCKV